MAFGDVGSGVAGAMAAEWERNLAMDGQDAATVAVRLTKSRERLLNAPALVLLCLYLEELDRYPDSVRQEAETTMVLRARGLWRTLLRDDQALMSMTAAPPNPRSHG